MTETSERIALLRRIHLFQRLNDAQLAEIAGLLQDENYAPGEVLFKQGSTGDRFLILFQGQVKVTRKRNEREEQLAVFVPGDYFGEEALLTGRRRSATVTAIEHTVALALPRDAFRRALRSMPGLRHNFDIALQSRQLARRLRFKWVRPDEVIYFLARRHEIELWRALAGPVLALVFPLAFFGLAAYFGTRPHTDAFNLGFWAPFVLGLGLTAVIVFLLLWRVVDWSNDYYIVTNHRVVYLEKVIGLYDSRQEAPLSTILSVGVETDMIGRALDYGDVVVRTFVGRINFSTVGHPKEAAALVEEHWRRVQARNVEGEKEAIKVMLRAKLGLPPEAGAPAPPAKAPAPESRRIAYKPGLRLLLSPNVFRTRFETGGTITYRKHLFVLLRQVAQPSLFLLLTLVAIVWRLVHLAGNPDIAVIHSAGVDTLLVLLVVLFLPILGWWIYQYIDWNNDIFQVTGDQILDIDRTPFGSEQRRSAPLDNILSTEYKRVGLWGYLLNFGTVYITVGGTQLAFEDVYDPAAVQQDIDQRRLAVKAKRQEAQVNMDRERMAEWMVAYHRAAEDLRAEQERRARPPENPE